MPRLQSSPAGATVGNPEHVDARDAVTSPLFEGTEVRQ
jgi:hypothetical protein